MVYASGSVGSVRTDVEDEGARVSKVRGEGGGWDGGEGLLLSESPGTGGRGGRGGWRGVGWGTLVIFGKIAREETGGANVSGTEAKRDGVCKVVVCVLEGGGRTGAGSDGDIGKEIVGHRGKEQSNESCLFISLSFPYNHVI